MKIYVENVWNQFSIKCYNYIIQGGGKSLYECLEDLFHPGRSAAVASAAVVVPAAGVVPLAGVGAGTAVAAAVAAGVAGAANGPTVK